MECTLDGKIKAKGCQFNSNSKLLTSGQTGWYDYGYGRYEMICVAVGDTFEAKPTGKFDEPY